MCNDSFFTCRKGTVCTSALSISSAEHSASWTTRSRAAASSRTSVTPAGRRPAITNPAANPKPLEVKGQLPQITRLCCGSGWPTTNIDWGTPTGASLTWTRDLTHSAHFRASQRTVKRLRKARSASLPSRRRSRSGAPGNVRRVDATDSSKPRNSANAARENRGVATSMVVSPVGDLRNSSTTRSAPRLRMSFMGTHGAREPNVAVNEPDLVVQGFSHVFHRRGGPRREWSTASASAKPQILREIRGCADDRLPFEGISRTAGVLLRCCFGPVWGLFEWAVEAFGAGLAGTVAVYESTRPVVRSVARGERFAHSPQLPRPVFAPGDPAGECTGK